MSAVEAAKWVAYRNKRGSLSLVSHLEAGFASLMALVINRTGGHASVADFLHYYKPAEDDEEEATLDDVMGILAGAMRHGK
jgi:hypothetical protein